MTPSADNSSSGIAEQLHRETTGLEQFIALLQDEQDLLKRGDSEPLLALVERKNTLANQLAVQARARENACIKLGLPAGRAGMEVWLDQHGSAADRRVWERFLVLVKEAHDLNMLNGKLIGIHMQHNQHALTALLAATDRAMTYGPDGQQQTSGSGRSLGSA